VLARDVAVGVEALEILPNGRLGDGERGGQVADARTSLFLQPGEDLHAARLGQEVRLARTVASAAERRLAPTSPPCCCHLYCHHRCPMGLCARRRRRSMADASDRQLNRVAQIDSVAQENNSNRYKTKIFRIALSWACGL
jgi:hypothetical protein